VTWCLRLYNLRQGPPIKTAQATGAIRAYHPLVSWSTLGTTALTLAIGALIGLAPTYLNERRKERREFSTRWDVPLYELSVEFASTVRVFRYRVSGMKGVQDPIAHRERCEDERQRLVSLLEQIRLIGTVRVQRAARMVVRHSWAILRVAEGHEDRRVAEFEGVPPQTRLTDSLHEFIRAVRAQLRVEDPEHIASDEPDDWPEQTEHRRPFRIGRLSQ
jgi:hypothetical protein